MTNIDMDAKELFHLLRLLSDEIKNLEKNYDKLVVGDRIDDQLRPIYLDRLLTLDRLHRKIVNNARKGAA